MFAWALPLNVIDIFLLGVAGINDTSSQTAYPGQLEDTGWSGKSSGVAKVRCRSFFSFSFFWRESGDASNIKKQSSGKSVS